MGKVKTIKEKTSLGGKKARERKPYLTKRILISAARQGFQKASEEAMQLMGYIVIAKDGWVVKKYADGTIEKISPIEQVNADNKTALD